MLGERVRELRLERGWRQVDLAQAAGISAPYLSDIELARTPPALKVLVDLARAFGMTLHDLLAPVEFTGQSTAGRLPAGLAELAADPTYGPQLTPDWLDALARIEHRGRRLGHRDEYLELFLHLRRVLA